jgi:opacity protein-like surface antigen
VTGQTAVGAALINGYYDFYNEDNDPTWIPYLGLGIGYSHVRNTVTFSVPYLFDEHFNFTRKVNKSTPIGQAIIGISYYYSDTTAFGLDYRYVTTRNIKQLGSKISTNTLNLNFNYWFND